MEDTPNTPEEMRELDAWVCEHVMGFKRTEQPDDYTETDKVLFWHRKGHAGKEDVVLVSEPYYAKGVGKYSHMWKRFHPTVDRDAAMQVQEKCADKIGILITAHGGGQLIRGTHNDGGVIVCVADAPTMPLAMTIFAKKVFTLKP